MPTTKRKNKSSSTEKKPYGIREVIKFNRKNVSFNRFGNTHTSFCWNEHREREKWTERQGDKVQCFSPCVFITFSPLSLSASVFWLVFDLHFFVVVFLSLAIFGEDDDKEITLSEIVQCSTLNIILLIGKNDVEWRLRFQKLESLQSHRNYRSWVFSSLFQSLSVNYQRSLFIIHFVLFIGSLHW